MSRRRSLSGSRVVLHLEPAEVELLQSLLADLDTAQGALDADDPVRRRLFPDGYADAEPAAEFRALTEATLQDERSARLQACVADLAQGADVELTDGADGTATRWIQSLNDLRLALGTRLDVQEDTVPHIDPTDPADHPWVIYHWLTAVQDRVVSRLMS